jgi:hypothetical protein
MKSLPSFLIALALTSTGAYAQTLFDPDFSSGSTPAGYTAVTTDSYTTGSGTVSDPYVTHPYPDGTITYANDQMTVGDIGAVAGNAYITSTTASNINSSSITSVLTFTPNYTVGTGNQANDIVFSLNTANANNPLLSVDFQPIDYGSPMLNITIGSGIHFGQDPDPTNPINDSTYSSPGTASLNGVTLTLRITTTFANVDGTETLSNVGVLSDASNPDLYTFDRVITSSDDPAMTGYDPANSPLTLTLGDQNDGNDGILNTGSSITIDSADVFVTPTPEPSTYALLLGGLGALAFIARRRLAA